MDEEKLMDLEYDAWHNLIAQIKRTFNINDFNDEQYRPLARAIDQWGIAHMELRMEQIKIGKITLEQAKQEMFPQKVKA